MTPTLSQIDIDRIADAVVKKMPAQPICHAFGPEEIAGLRGILAVVAQTRMTALATVVGFLVLGALGLLVGGVVGWIRGIL